MQSAWSEGPDVYVCVCVCAGLYWLRGELAHHPEEGGNQRGSGRAESGGVMVVMVQEEEGGGGLVSPSWRRALTFSFHPH